ncbi:TOA2, Transcription initiation factor IIA, gamma subunit, partial [Pyrenophora tritici-repentis]
GYASTLVIEEVIELLEYPEMPQDDDISIEDLLTARQRQHSRQTAPVTSAPTAGGSQVAVIGMVWSGLV